MMSRLLYLFVLLSELADLLDHLCYKDHIHLVGEVGRLCGVNQQLLSYLDRIGQIQRHL